MTKPMHLPNPGEPLYEAALALWKHRELRLPEHTRRMKPDSLDVATGSWARTVKEAEATINGYFSAMHKPG